MPILAIKLKKIIVCFAAFCFIAVSAIVIRRQEIAANAALIGLTVVIDAGHGGRDGGVVGKHLGLEEASLNLTIAKMLEGHLRRSGFSVIQTRKNSEGLYHPNASNKKKDDMQMRRQIIEQAEPDLVVSIHQNGFPDTSVKGSAVFYNPDNEASQVASQTIARELLRIDHIKYVQNKSANYYILDMGITPAVLVECVYLSNYEDEIFINDNGNKEKMAFAIFCGIVRFFGVENY